MQGCEGLSNSKFITLGNPALAHREGRSQRRMGMFDSRDHNREVTR